MDNGSSWSKYFHRQFTGNQDVLAIANYTVSSPPIKMTSRKAAPSKNMVTEKLQLCQVPKNQGAIPIHKQRHIKLWVAILG